MKAELTPGALVWASYAEAYERRYHVPPVRNKQVNSMLKTFTERVPAEEAPAIAAHYVGNPSQLYVASGHAVNLLLRDAEKLRTEWITGRRITQTQARTGDQTAANPFARMALEQESQERKA